MQLRDFDKLAAGWDDDPKRVALARRITEGILTQVKLSPEARVLDFGAGTGLVSLPLLPSVGALTAADGSAAMLEVLRTKAARAGLPGLQTVLVNLPGANPQVAEAHAVDSLEGPFDLIICSMTLHHVPDPGPLLVVFRRLLAKGGALALADLDSEDGGFHQDNTGVFHFGFHREALGRLLGQAGFQDLASSTVAVIPRGRPDGTSKDYSVFLTVAR